MPASTRRRLALVLPLTALLAAASPSAAGSFVHGLADDGFEYALVGPGGNGRTIVSSTRSWQELERRLDRDDEPVFWFALDGRSWLVRDPATVGQARTILEPVHALGKKQGKLGGRQGALGGRQGALGGQQGSLGARQGVLGARLGAIAARSARRGRESAADRAERRDIEEEMEDLSRRMAELARRHEPLAEEQRALGAEQAELAPRQVEASKKAGGELRRLARRAIEDGRAERAD